MTKISENEYRILKGHFSDIGRSIPSARARKTGHISPQYVKRVLMGIEKRDNETTRLIFQKAQELLRVLK